MTTLNIRKKIYYSSIFI